MNKLHLTGWLAIATSFFIAFLLTILPLPTWAMWFRPPWVLLVMMYWVLTLPHRFNLVVAWVLGLLLDGMSGTLLGQHALSMTTVAYIVLKGHQQIRFFPIWQQASLVFVLILIYQLLQLLIQGFVGQLSYTWLLWLPALTSMLLWPWLFVVLRDVRQHYRVY